MPVALKSSGGGSVTMDVPSTASTFTLTLPASTGTALTTATAVTVAQGGTGLSTMTAANNALYSTSSSAVTAGTLPVAAGGTGLATLTANNVLLGNGTGTPNFVAPGSNGNILTSNGTTWTSAAPASGGVTSLTAGNGITVSASTGAVTVSQDIYTGSTANNTSFPVGTTILANNGLQSVLLNATQTIRFGQASNPYSYQWSNTSFSALSGTWRCRGFMNGPCSEAGYLFQRTA
jgi:hypothetical protein